MRSCLNYSYSNFCHLQQFVSSWVSFDIVLLKRVPKKSIILLTATWWKLRSRVNTLWWQEEALYTELLPHYETDLWLVKSGILILRYYTVSIFWSWLQSNWRVLVLLLLQCETTEELAIDSFYSWWWFVFSYWLETITAANNYFRSGDYCIITPSACRHRRITVCSYYSKIFYLNGPAKSSSPLLLAYHLWCSIWF